MGEPQNTGEYRTKVVKTATAALFLIAAIGIGRLLLMTPACAQRNDFAHYYVSSRALLAGDDPYQVSLEHRYAELGFEFDERIPHATNPPPLLWLFAPFAVLPPIVACWGWQALQVVALLWMFWLTWQLTRDRLTPLAMAAAVAGVTYSNPLYWHVYHSQVQLLLGAMLLSAFWANRRGRHNLACWLVLAAGLLKLFPLVLLPWFLWSTGERLPTKLKRAGGIAAVGIALLLLSGPHLWSAFVQHGLTVVTSNAVNRTFNFGLPSLLGNLVYAWHDFHPPQSSVLFARRFGILAGLALIAGGYLICALGKPNRKVQFSLLCFVMLAGGATMWGHYLVLLIFPGLIAALSIRDSTTVLPKALVAVALMILLMAGTAAPHFTSSTVVNVLLHYLPLAAVLTLAMALCWKLLRTSDLGAAENLPAGGLKVMFLRPIVRRP